LSGGLIGSTTDQQQPPLASQSLSQFAQSGILAEIKCLKTLQINNGAIVNNGAIAIP